MRLLYWLCLLSLLLCVKVSDSQTGSANLSIYALRFADNHQKAYLSNGDDTVEISLSTARILGPYPIEILADATVVLKSKKVTEEGDLVLRPIAEAKLQSEIREPLMILVPSAERLPYRSIIIEKSTDDFVLGSYLLVNLAPMKLRARVGSNEFVALANSVTAIIPSSKEGDFLDVQFENYQPDGWKTFARTQWVNNKAKRSLLFAYLEPNTDRLKIKGIPIETPAVF